MSSMPDSMPSNSPKSNASGQMPSMGSIWGRLIWKDAREVVPIWITLLFAAVLCLVVTWTMVNSGRAHIAPLYISAHTFIALCSVITGVYLLASEDENRTLHLLRNLPVAPKQIVWQKFLLGTVGVVLLSCLIAAFTMLLAQSAHCSPLGAKSPFGFSLANVTLLPLLYLAVASLSAMVSRSHFYGVLIAGIVTFGIIAVLEPTWLGASVGDYQGRGEIRWLWVALALIGGCFALVANANHWVEEKVATVIPLQGRHTKASFTEDSGTTVPNPFSRLLWQSFRQSRALLAWCLGMTVVGWIVSTVWIEFNHRFDPNVSAQTAVATTMVTLFWMLAMVSVFASSVSLDDKRHNNYLFFQQNRERPKWFWFSRLLPFWGLALLLSLLWNFFVFDLGVNNIVDSFYDWNFDARHIEMFSSMRTQAASQSFLVPLLCLLGIIGIGQYFSMFVRNPILAFVFTGVVSVIFVGLFAYVVYVDQSVWWFVFPIVAAIYAATWWRAKSWLASSPHWSSFLLPLALPVVVLAIVSAAFINHRANEFRSIQLSPDNYAEWSHGKFADQKNWALVNVEFGSKEQRQQAAKLYQEAVQAHQGGFSLMDGTQQMPWSAKKSADYVAKNRLSISKIIKAAEIPACAPFLSEDPQARGNERWALRQSALVNSHHQLLEGNLSAAKASIDALERVVQRSDPGQINRYESGYYGFLLAWADHPNQELKAIKSAIAHLEGTESDIAPTKLVNSKGDVVENDSPAAFGVSRFYQEFGGERAFMNLQYEISDLRQDNANHDLSEIKSNFRLFPWEYQRLLKVGELRALRKFDRVQSAASSQPLRNDYPLKRTVLDSQLNKEHYWPRIPIAEDRIGYPLYSVGYDSYWQVGGILEGANWRRYVLLRLGLAAHKLEHDQYPDDLTQLKPYFQNGLPKTSDGLMFGWFKDGLGADLVKVVYINADLIEVDSAVLIAAGTEPLLLPFSIDQDNPLPKPIEYGEGKSGINVRNLTSNRAIYVPNYNTFSYYKSKWNPGGQRQFLSEELE